MEISSKSIQGSLPIDQTGTGELSLWRVLLLIFVPTSVLMLLYIPAAHLLRDTLPSLLVFFLLAVLVLFPFQLFVVISASRKEYGRYSLESAFSPFHKLSAWKILLYGSVVWGFAGLMTILFAPLEAMLFAPITQQLSPLIPPYYDWANLDYLQHYSRNVLLFTGISYLFLNGFFGPIVEELFFRGYLTAKIRRYGKYAPLLITVLFSLYHFWLPFNNLFRILVFFPAAYLAWKKKNIHIAIVFHCLSNLVSAFSLNSAILAML
jgi:uncharacterized protein